MNFRQKLNNALALVGLVTMNRGLAFAGVTTVALLTSNVMTQAQEKKKPPKITYDEHVLPILKQKCFSCHNPDKASGDLDMTNYTNLMQGSGSGAIISNSPLKKTKRKAWKTFSGLS